MIDGERSGSLRLRSRVADPLVPNRIVERFAQYYSGVPIWGAEIVVDSERGVPLSVFGVVAPDLSFSVEPAIPLDTAAQIVRSLGGTTSTLMTMPELVVLPMNGGEYRLVYHAVVATGDDIVRLFIDAQSGLELMRVTEIQTQAAVGTGTGVLGDRKKLSVDQTGGMYLAFDRHRPPVLQTFDLRGNLARFKLLQQGLLSYTTADLATDSDNLWTDPAVVDAHVHVSWTYDYYYSRFGRSGLDGRDSPINIVTNAVFQQSALSLPSADFFSYAVNAFWCGTCGPLRQGLMYFGNGIPAGFVITSSGQNFTYLAGSLDTAAHELTHGVVAATSRLIYLNESGALNEAFADMMGKSVEFFYHPPGSNVGQADYVIGKDVVRAGRVGVLNGIRSMSNPAMYGHPDHFSGRALGPDDGGGVHTNSGIANQAFYLAIEGGINRTSALNVSGVGASRRDQIERVFYRAFTLLLPSNATFPLARAATIQAARDLYGLGSDTERAVTQAWTAVGVPDPASILTRNDVVARGARNTYVVIANANGRLETDLAWTSLAANDLDLYLTPEGCPSTQASCVLAQSITGNSGERVVWTVRSGERYWATVHNYAGNASSFVLRHWMQP